MVRPVAPGVTFAAQCEQCGLDCCECYLDVIPVTVEEPTAEVWEAVSRARGLLAVEDWADEFDTGVRALAEPLF